jgi:hypothetical protein
VQAFHEVRRFGGALGKLEMLLAKRPPSSRRPEGCVKPQQSRGDRYGYGLGCGCGYGLGCGLGYGYGLGCGLGYGLGCGLG